MSRKVEFFTIALVTPNGITNYSISEFFMDISLQLFNGDGNRNIVRRIGEKWIRVFPYYFTDNQHQFVIPFGKLKDKNKPYWINEDNRLEEVPENLYDINSLGYDSDYNVMMFTTNKEGPTWSNVEEYLNTFIPRYTGLSVKIEPIIYNTGIEKVRNAELVREVTLKLDLGQTLNNFYLNQIAANEQRPLLSSIKAIAETAKDVGGSRVLDLSFKLGKYGKKGDTLDLESVLYMLENINLEQEFVKEIIVHYKTGRDDRLDIARLKQTQLFLSYLCKCNETQVSPISLLNNINTAVGAKVLEITRHLRVYFANLIDYPENRFGIVTEWNNDMQ